MKKILALLFTLGVVLAEAQTYIPLYGKTTVTGTDTYVANPSPSLALQNGATIKLEFTNPNTGASTLNVSGTGAKALVKFDGTALSASDIPALSTWLAIYDASSTKWRLIGGGGSSNFWATSGSTNVTTPTIVGDPTFTGNIALSGDLNTITFGTSGVSSTLAGIYLARLLSNGNTGGVSPHGLADNSVINCTGCAYNFLDGKFQVSGTNNDHTAGLQMRASIAVTGTMNNYYGTYMIGLIGSGTVTNWYNHYSAALSSMTGSLGTMVGYYTEDLTQASTNWGFYSAGDVLSSFGGLQVRDLTTGTLVAATTSGRLTTALRSLTLGTGAAGVDALSFGGTFSISINQSTGQVTHNAVSTLFQTFNANGSEVLRLTTSGAGQFSGDVSFSSGTKGVVLKDTQGTPHYWRVTVSNVGVLTVTDIGTTIP